MNIIERFQDAWSEALDRPCLVSPQGPSLTYSEMDDLSARFAAVLLGAGLQPGERVVVQVDKSFGNVALYLGVLRAGGVYVPLNTGYTTSEVRYFIENADPRVVVCRPSNVDEVSAIATDLGVPTVEAPGTDAATGLWAKALAAAPARDVVEREPDDLAAIVYTSGTTGRSKGAMLSHANLIDNAEVLHKLWGFNSDDVLIHALPIFHVHGLFVALHTSMLNATPMIFLPAFDAELIRSQLPKATLLMGVPTFYSRLGALDGFGADDCRNMRLFISGSAPLTAKASDDWTEKSGHRVLERYGMSEAGMITSNPLDGDRIAGTVGFAVPGYDIRVADDTGKELPRGETGVIEIKGPSLFQGYWRMPEKTAEEFRADGYFITGDNAVMDETGRVSIVGRAKDLIISGGYNIYPKEIELVLDAIPGVLETAVIGAPHPEMGEGVVAVLVATGAPVPDEQMKQALEGSLARFKHPRRFIWLDALPRNTMGKVQKAELRKQFAGAYSA
ncbi:MAG: AMP-binding protein [Hyphomonadaceae bacterium]